MIFTSIYRYFLRVDDSAYFAQMYCAKLSVSLVTAVRSSRRDLDSDATGVTCVQEAVFVKRVIDVRTGTNYRCKCLIMDVVPDGAKERGEGGRASRLA